jgi:hypothetical protein
MQLKNPQLVTCSIASELPCRNRTRALRELYGLMTVGEQFTVPPRPSCFASLSITVNYSHGGKASIPNYDKFFVCGAHV